MTIARGTFGDQVAREIIKEIQERRLQPGDEIPAEGELAERHGVNRLSVREAIRILVARGVLLSSQGRRARVATPSPAVLEQIIAFRLSQESMDLRDLLETRRVIEGELARRAAVRVAEGLGGTEQAELALQAMRTASDSPESFIAADLAFHDAVKELADAQVFSFILTALNGVLLDARRASYLGRERRGTGQQATIDEHARILHAIAEGDGEAAAEAMTVHLAQTGHDLGL
ncbi:FCD domain-containing protein [Streptomyces sp. NBC_01453]|uniref:FadR/GntR family transcriptional regulator n=1 Tax=Streptomyces sp. NBC_01453 TaxID=2903873 RepID=UPI002E2C3C49|nr:FCD domain-containing protein [Streptomyces sp. NBC_01453]